MNSDKKRLFLITISLLLILFVTLFIPKPISKYLLVIFLIIFVVLIIYFIRKRKVFSINKQQVLYIFIGFGLVYLTIYYLFGIKFGFYKSDVLNLFTDALPLIFGIVLIEIIRNILLSQENRVIDVFTFILCIVCDCILFSNTLRFNTFYAFIDFIGLIILPSLIANIMYQSISKEYGYQPNIAYRAIISLHTLFIAFVPNIPGSLLAIINLIYPLIMLGTINFIYKNNNKVIEKKFKLSPIIMGICIISSILFGLLISNQFKVGALVIATDSMTGEINKGDLIIFEKIDKDDKIEEDNIIVFKKEDNFIVHRVIEIENIDNENRYYTKGDANEGLDDGYITDSNIVGIVNFKLSYLGYPSLWLRQFFD